MHEEKARVRRHVVEQWRNTMRTPASLAKHPIHPMLVVSPIGLWSFSLICGLIGMSVATTFTVALYTMISGLIGALAAAVQH
jgi:uncharacterized membrane protein